MTAVSLLSSPGAPMADFDLNYIAKSIAAKIKGAVDADDVDYNAGRIKTARAFTSTNLADVLREIGLALEESLTEEHIEAVAYLIAEHIGWHHGGAPMRRLIKGGSADSLSTMTQQMESMFLAVRK